MKVHFEDLSDVSRYIKKYENIKLEDKEKEFESFFKYIKRFKVINRDTHIMEIGTGTGWFTMLCKKNGISCKGLEVSPQLVEFANSLGLRYGIETDIELGNIEEKDIGESKYDIIVASSTFEHVEHWQRGIRKIFNALKPGGLFFFYSTNKFSLKSAEYNFPFYNWLPNCWRYRLRISCQGEDIMKLGIDFNQFTYFQLRRFFKNSGFSNVLDVVEILNPDHLNNPKFYKKVFLKVLKRLKIIKHIVLFFSTGTFFICIK